MSNPTSNFGWQMPTPTDLVTDLPADFEVFGQAVDSTLADLKGGTSGQVLSKNSNTDMDFVWTTPNPGDITGVTATSPLTGGGTSGDVTVGIQDGTTAQKGAVQLTDSTSSTSTTTAATPNSVKSSYDLAVSAYAPAFTNNFYAGKNKIINGDFKIWQRGTSFSFSSTDAYTADRFMVSAGSGGTVAVTQQTFTPGAAPVAGYEGSTYLQAAYSVSGTGCYIYQKIEDVRTFAAQTVVVSFWARVTSGTKSGCYVDIVQNFGSGGSGTVVSSSTDANVTFTTTWTRFTQIVPVASISGKTIGTSSFIYPRIQYGTSGTSTFQFWGVQVEAGSVATPFQTATGTIQGELAACQRYYFRLGAGCAGIAAGVQFGHYLRATATSTTNLFGELSYPVTMRRTPTAIDFSNVGWIVSWGAGVNVISAITIYDGGNVVGSNPQSAVLQMTTTGAASGTSYPVIANNSTASFIGLSAEL